MTSKVYCSKNIIWRYETNSDSNDCDGPTGVGACLECQGCNNLCPTRDELIIKIGNVILNREGL